MKDLFEGIGYVAATFKVNSTTKSYLEANCLNAKTGNVDINGKKLAVALDEDGKVGFGASTPTGADALFGIIVAYEMDGHASVQIKGGVDEVPTVGEIDGGYQQLVVNNKGEIDVLATELDTSDTTPVLTLGGAEKYVANPATSTDKFASIIL